MTEKEKMSMGELYLSFDEGLLMKFRQMYIKLYSSYL